jgi:hypothetical protein
MQLMHLSLVQGSPTGQAASPAAPVCRRKLFWRAYLDWLSTATADETEQFELVMSAHAHHVRPLMDAITDALRTLETALRLPLTLLAELHSSGWRPVIAPSTTPSTTPSAAPRDGWPVVA